MKEEERRKLRRLIKGHEKSAAKSEEKVKERNPFNKHPAEDFLRRTKKERAEQIVRMPPMISITDGIKSMEELENLATAEIKKMSKKEQIAVAATIYRRSLEMSIRAIKRAKEVEDLERSKDDNMVFALVVKSDAYMNQLEKFINASKVSYKKMYPDIMSGAKGIFDDYMTADLENYWKSNEQNINTIFDEILGHEWLPFIGMRLGKP